MSAARLPDLACPTFKADPHPTYARLREGGPVLRAGGGRVWVVARHADVEAALRDPRLARLPAGARGAGVRLPVGRGVPDLDAPEQARVRALVGQALAPRLVERLRRRAQHVVDVLLTRALPRGHMDVVADLALPLPFLVRAELLGVPLADQPRFQQWTMRLVAASSLLDVLALVPAAWSLARYVRRLAAQRRAEARDDLLTALVEAEDERGPLSDDEVLGVVLLLLVSGRETTATLVSGAVHALLAHEAQCERLRDAPSLAGCAVEELARYTSPVDVAAERYAREPVELGGVRVARGDRVLALVGAANRDPARFDAPDVLDLGRDPNPHLAFGVGAHDGIGASLARLETRLAVGELLARAPDLRLAVPAETLRWRRHRALRGLEALPVLC